MIWLFLWYLIGFVSSAVIISNETGYKKLRISDAFSITLLAITGPLIPVLVLLTIFDTFVKSFEISKYNVQIIPFLRQLVEKKRGSP